MTILGKKQMSEEDIKLNYITPSFLMVGKVTAILESAKKWNDCNRTAKLQRTNIIKNDTSASSPC